MHCQLRESPRLRTHRLERILASFCAFCETCRNILRVTVGVRLVHMLTLNSARMYRNSAHASLLFLSYSAYTLHHMLWVVTGRGQYIYNIPKWYYAVCQDRRRGTGTKRNEQQHSFASSSYTIAISLEPQHDERWRTSLSTNLSASSIFGNSQVATHLCVDNGYDKHCRSTKWIWIVVVKGVLFTK